MTTKHIINLDALHAITDGNKELELRLFELYRETADNCLAQMKAGISSEESEKWNDYVHQLKGASANIGAEEVRDLCAESEFLKAGEVSEKSRYHESISRAVSRLMDSIATIKASPGKHNP